MPISDLTGTTWVFDSVVNGYSASPSYWGVNFTSNGNSYTVIYDKIEDDGVLLYGDSTPTVYSYGSWANDGYKTIAITGGTDATNSTLISWLEANATQQSSQLSADLSTLSGWSNVSSGSHTLKVKAKATGYQDSALSEGASFTKGGGLTGYTLTFALSYEGDNADIYYKTPSDQTGTLWTQCTYGNTITIQDCTAFQVSNPSAGVNSATGTLTPPCQSGDYIEYTWLSLGSDVSINLTVWQ